MTVLSKFRAQPFVQQVQALDRVEREKRVDQLDALFDLTETPVGDDAVDQAVRDTLRALLRESEEHVIRGLRSSVPEVCRLCLRVVAERPVAEAIPVLRERAATEGDPELLLEVLTALARFGSREFLPDFRRHLAHPDPLVSSQCLEMIGVYGDRESFGHLCAVVDAAGAEGAGETCDLPTEKAIGALARLGDDRALAYLCEKIHHPSPSVRRVVADNLAWVGAPAVPHLSRVLVGGSEDDRILAANLLGTIGDRRGADALVAAFDRGTGTTPNVRFAIYEALGEIASLKGLVCLADGLGETDEMILLGVVAALEKQLNPGVAAQVFTALDRGGDQADRILGAVVGARATGLFREVYGREEWAEPLARAVAASAEPETIDVFRRELVAMGGDRATRHAARLEAAEAREPSHRLLAVDDSRSMLLFYQSVAAAMGFQVATAASGREALDLVERGEAFDLVITDLNMPQMDGVEFTRQLRERPESRRWPVLMVTTESEASQVELARRAGVDGFLQKPVTADVLGERLQRFL